MVINDCASSLIENEKRAESRESSFLRFHAWWQL